MLHLLNGDAAADRLRPAGLPGELAVWADVLLEGPVPRDLTAAPGREVRARFIAARGYASYGDALATYRRWDGALESYASHDEVVLWLEHDLFDQLLLIHHLHWFRGRRTGRTRLSLICIGGYPGVEGFRGLGELEPAQLAPLLDTRKEVTREQMETGAAAWDAFTAPDPLALQAFLGRDSGALPFLAPTLRRLLEDYPSARDGLSRTERQILGALAAGPVRVQDLFRDLTHRERVYHPTDASIGFHLRDLAGGARPLVLLRDDADRKPLPGGSAGLTEDGRAVLEGREDRVRLLGLDRWLGGVHLDGAGDLWRWDEERERPVRSER